MSGVSLNCYDTRLLLPLGWNRSDEVGLAEDFSLIPMYPSDREDGLAHGPCLIPMCPNDHGDGLARSL